MKIIASVLLLLSCHILLAQSPEISTESILSKYPHIVLKKGDFKITKQVNNYKLGVLHVYGFQTYKGLEIENAEFNANLKDDRIINLNQSFVPTNNIANNAIFIISKTQALDAVLQSIEGAALAKPKIVWQQDESHLFSITDSELSPEKITLKKGLFYIDQQITPSYSISYLLPDESHWYYISVSAIDGSILSIIDWTHSCTAGFHQHKTETCSGVITSETFSSSSKKASEGTYNVLKRPIASPAHGDFSLVTNPANKTASPYGWHDVNGIDGAEYTITRGNNVWASEDKDDLDYPGYSPDGGVNLIFDSEYKDFNSSDQNLDAAITNLFYWNNLMHDVWYQYGFDEESGNFQANNYGNFNDGSGDYVYAEAQDGSGTNNANFSTPTDGINPRMQMYLWDNSNPTITISAPSALAGDYYGKGASFGHELNATPILGTLIEVKDNSTAPTLACNTLLNPSSIKGKIALIERGDCNFSDKIRNAQDAGAIAVVIYTDNRAVGTMGGTNVNDINIPSIMIDRSLGLALVDELKNNTININLFNNSTNIQLDSDFENGVISHEYGHGISTRLTGGAYNSNCLRNNEQMGEGWSDFFALVMTHQKTDKATDVRAIGTYLQGTGISGPGIRPYPYSVDTTESKYNYNDVKTFSIPHGVGAVWCAMLWDMYWAFIDEYGYDEDIYNGTGGNNMAMQLVIDGLKLQPCEPGFVDGRNAILLADSLNNGGANKKLIWQAFSKRGLGAGASQGSSNSIDDGKVSYKLPAEFLDEFIISKTAPTSSIFGQPIDYSISIKNPTTTTMFNIQLVDSLDKNASFIMSSISCSDAIVVDNVLSLQLDSLKAGTTFTCQYQALANESFQSKNIWKNKVESLDDFQFSGGFDNNYWQLNSENKTVGQFSLFAPNTNTSSDLSLVINLNEIADSSSFSFDHYYNTEEGWDGAVVEISIDNGNTWTDAESLFSLNGYNTTIATNPESAISTQKAFSGDSKTFINSIIDLSNYANQDIQIKFRMVSDGAESVEGWYIDNFKLIQKASISNTYWALGDKVKSTGTNTIIFNESDTLSTNNQSIETLNIFPNPISNYVNIQLNQAVKGYVVILDMQGRTLIQQHIDQKSMLHINTSALSKGSYIIQVETQNGVMRNKLIKN